ncbi:MAG: glycosyltransferase, partial [Cyanobium sp.]
MASFILVATADWDHPLWTNKQHLAVALAELGHRVLYVESLGLRGPRSGRSDFGRILKRLGRALRPPRQVRQGVWVWSPLVIPGGTSGLSLRINRLLLRAGLALALPWARLWKPLLWTFNPLVHDYLPLKIFHSTVYQCVDRVQAQPGMPAERLELAERDLCRRVNVVFTTAPELQKRLESLNPATHAFGNVADADHFGTALSDTHACPEDMRSLPHPRILFMGAIDAYKLHLPMLEALARATPQWTYVLIGPVGETDPNTDVGALRQMSNVRLLGTKPYADLPAYLSHADVALLPLRHNDYTHHMFPMKFFEYLAAGCPVVATAIPSLADQADVALLCEPEAEAFERAIAMVLAGGGPPLEQRLERARQHTYRARTAALVGLLEMHGLLPLDSGPPAPPRRRRLQVWPEVVAALPVLALAHGLERVGRPMAARGLLEGMHQRWPRNLVLLESLAPRRIAGGDYLGGRQLLEALWLDRADTRHLCRLLFRRSARPRNKTEQLRLFEVLAESPILPRHLSGYSQVVLTYRAIDFKDAGAIRASLPALGRLIEHLDADPGTYKCLRPNRENRAKLLVSAQLARLHALLTLEDWPGLEAGCQRLMRSAGRYDPSAIDLDTAARMTRNILRCLTLEVVMAWHASDRERYGRAVAQIKRLQQASEHPDLDSYIAATQEDHRGFAAELVRQLKNARWRGD